MVLNDRAMANVVPAPKHDIASDLNKGLDRIVFQDKTIVANVPRKTDRVGADVTSHRVAHFFQPEIFFQRSELVVGRADVGESNGVVLRSGGGRYSHVGDVVRGVPPRHV